MKEWCAGVAMIAAFTGCGDSDCTDSANLFDPDGIECQANLFSLTRGCITDALSNNLSFKALWGASGDDGTYLIKNHQSYYVLDFYGSESSFVACTGLVDTAVSDTCDGSPDHDQWCFHCENPAPHEACD